MQPVRLAEAFRPGLALMTTGALHEAQGAINFLLRAESGQLPPEYPEVVLVVDEIEDELQRRACDQADLKPPGA